MKFADETNEEIDFSYDKRGIILDSAHDKRLVGVDAMNYLCTLLDHDVGVANTLKANDPDALVYSFDSSVYEKTPKDNITGIDHFVGRNFLEFHEKARTFGPILKKIMQ